MSSGEESNREEELAIVNLENVKRISETYKPSKGKGANKKGTIPKSVVQDIWKDRLSPRFYSRLMSVMFPEESNEVSFLSFYTIYKNLAEPETEIMFRALTIYHIATIHEPPFNYEQANEYPNASYKAIKDYICDVITSYLHAIIHINMKEAHAWLDFRASNTLIDGNLVASYMLKDLETHRNEVINCNEMSYVPEINEDYFLNFEGQATQNVSIGSLEIWLEKNEMYYTVSEQLYLFLFGVNSHANVQPLIPLPVVQTGRLTKTLLALPDVLLLNSKLPKRAQRWRLAYMLDSRSQNWETFKQAIYGKGQTIIVIQDANGDIFGLYGSQKWFPSEGFFGNDECFLFTLKPDVNIYERSGRDNNFQLFTESGIGMGGTADRLGLFIQSDTGKGSTSLACSTFREFWPLGRELEFKITQLEIWAVDDEEAQEAVEQDVGKLISNTQYMRMGGDETYNEKRTPKKPKSNQPQDVPDLDKTPEMPTMCGPLRCCGECAMSPQKYGTRYNQGRVCCSKRCKEKIEERCCPRGEGDGNADLQTAQRYPRQEEERRQCHYRCSEEQVKMKRENKSQRISFDALQKHGAAAGFIHPSLAAEENERNAREAKEAKALSPSSLISKSSRSKTSKKYRSSFERDLSQKSNSPTHNKTQVGESRLMKPTCRLYKNENKCACVVKKSCACTPKETSPGTSQKTYSFKTEHNTKEITSPELTIRNECTPTKTAKSNFKTREIDCDSVKTYICRPYTNKDFTAESSSTVLIEMNSSCPNVTNEPVALSRCNSPVSEANIKGNKSRFSPIMAKDKPAKKSEQPISEANNKTKNVKLESDSKKKEKVYEDKGKQEDKSLTFSTQKTYSEKNLNENMKASLQAELDCHCSSSTDCDDVEVRNKKFDPAAMCCCCEAKVSSYLTKMNRTDITGVPLTEISSSVCSCIFDNKNKITATPTGSSMNSCKKETQNFTKSRRKSDGSSYSVSKNATKPKKTRTNESPNSSFASKKETQLLTKSRRASRTGTISSVHSKKQPPPVPPTCLRCKTLVGRDGCQCKARSTGNKVIPTPVETFHLVQKELAMKNGGSRRSVAIDTGAMSFISDGSKVEQDSESESGSMTPSKIISRASSQSSQIKPAQKKTCKTSCKCSLSRSYFPVFPEDLIKEAGTLEDCDCASYNNLRFPIIVETPPDLSPEPSEKSRTTMEPDQANEQEAVQEIKDKDCGCDDNDNTIIILNVSKCNTAGTVQKIIQELEVKTGEASNPNVSSLVFKCGKDFSESRPCALQYSPCTTKSGPEREALRQQIERILKRNSQVTQPEPEQEEQP